MATDFSAPSTKAVRQAVAVAQQCQACLTILHVIDINTRGELGPAAEAMPYLWKSGSSKMGQLACSLMGQVNATTILEEGLPSEVIVSKSKEFDLLILGHSGQRKGWQFCSKQTVWSILELATCSVMLVRIDD